MKPKLIMNFPANQAKRVMMFINVDSFYLSHRKSLVSYLNEQPNISVTVFAELTRKYSDTIKAEYSMARSPIKRKINVFYLLIEFFKLLALINKEKPDIVHGVTIKPIILCGLCCMLLRKNFIASITGLGPAFVADNLLKKLRLWVIIRIYKLILNRDSTYVICQSDHDLEYLKQNIGINEHRLLKIKGSGVATDVFRPHSKSNPLVTILMASRLLHTKGVAEYFHVARLVKNATEVKVRFLLAGPLDEYNSDSLTEAELSSLLEERTVDYLGNLKCLSEQINVCDIFVLPSYYPEGIPKVLLEAASSGCAIVTTNSAGCRECVQDGISGILVEPKNTGELYNAIMSLITDSDYREKLALNARELALDEYDEKIIFDQHYKVYNSIF